MQATRPICPWCGRLDFARKVSAIHAAGTRRTSGYYDDFLSQTDLAARLAPPERPRLKGGRPLKFWLAAGPISLVASFAFVMPGLPYSTTLLWLALVTLAVCVMVDEVARRGRRTQQLHAWEVDVLIWRQAFYCGRCDLTFVPAPSVSAAPVARPATGETIRLSS